MTGKEFKLLREQCGWTQYFLADLLGSSRSAISHYEQGRMTIPLDIAKALRDVHRIILAALHLLAPEG